MKYKVTIEATVRKDIEVEANSEMEAATIAHEQFSVLPEEGEPEKYDEQTLEVINLDELEHKSGHS